MAVLISSTGRVNELLDAADVARARGAKVLAITPSQSPLVKKADVALIVDHEEDVDTQMPMISRVLHLLMIDILAVGLAMRRSGDAQKPAQKASAGASVSVPLARMTSHSR